MSRAELSPAQRAEAHAHGLTDVDISRQLELYASPPPPTRLIRPCIAADGIRVIAPALATGMAKRYGDTLGDRVPVGFVPASGAASRMFKAPLATFHSSEPVTLADLERSAEHSSDARDVLDLLRRAKEFGFYEALAARATTAGVALHYTDKSVDVRPALGLLVGPQGLDYGNVPKGLLPFHRYDDGARTAFEEHLVEAAEYGRDAHGVCRLHFTVSAEHEDAFRKLFDRVAASYEKRFGVRYEVGFSTQHPSTDALAVEADNRPFTLADGSLLFRPGGHGSLIENLGGICGATAGDLIFVKNIDNVVPDHLKADTLFWKKVLGVLLLDVRAKIFASLAALDAAEGGAIEQARALLRDELGIALAEGSAEPDTLRDLLDRPLRVCGMVRNAGEPGGGPFWVPLDGRATLQIVEASQVDTRDPEQRRILQSATHFNPVDLVCSIRNRTGKPYDLHRYIDEQAVFIVEKSKDGRPLKSLERPGLWNGAMARWNTIFVEVPAITFHPVKTVNALLTAAHQPPA
jgi:hypothetical protein